MVQNDGVGNIERLHGYRQPQKELYAVWGRHGCCVFFLFLFAFVVVAIVGLCIAWFNSLAKAYS